MTLALSLATLLLIAADPHPGGDSVPPRDEKPKLRFVDLRGQPNDRYTFDLVVEVEGGEKTFESKKNTVTGGLSARVAAAFFSAQLEQVPGWKYSVARDELVIEGWTDPKTKTFHPVKAIKFTSPDFPKEALPVVTIPGRKV